MSPPLQIWGLSPLCPVIDATVENREEGKVSTRMQITRTSGYRRTGQNKMETLHRDLMC